MIDPITGRYTRLSSHAPSFSSSVASSLPSSHVPSPFISAPPSPPSRSSDRRPSRIDPASVPFAAGKPSHRAWDESVSSSLSSSALPSASSSVWGTREGSRTESRVGSPRGERVGGRARVPGYGEYLRDEVMGREKMKGRKGGEWKDREKRVDVLRVEPEEVEEERREEEEHKAHRHAEKAHHSHHPHQHHSHPHSNTLSHAHHHRTAEDEEDEESRVEHSARRRAEHEQTRAEDNQRVRSKPHRREVAEPIDSHQRGRGRVEQPLTHHPRPHHNHSRPYEPTEHQLVQAVQAKRDRHDNPSPLLPAPSFPLSSVPSTVPRLPLRPSLRGLTDDPFDMDYGYSSVTPGSLEREKERERLAYEAELKRIREDGSNRETRMALKERNNRWRNLL